jgi:hypothetical protein
MTDKKKQFIDYLDASIQEALGEEKKLLLDDRKDEAILVKIKGNIFGIFKKIFLAVTKNKNLEEQEIRASFLEKLETIPESWRASYENAKIHNDAEKILTEEIKLQTSDLICNKFNELWGEKG